MGQVTVRGGARRRVAVLLALAMTLSLLAVSPPGSAAVDTAPSTASSAALAVNEAPTACPAGQVPSSGFEDRVEPYAWAIDCLAWHGLTEGRTARLYEPFARTNRGQLSSFVVRVLQGLDGVTLPPPAAPGVFSDVTGSPHAEAIHTLVRLEPAVLRGYPDGTFRPLQPVTRGQLASIVVRADAAVAGTVAGYSAIPAGDPAAFPDIAGDVHREAIGRVASAGIVLGRTDGTFGPTLDANRGQIAIVLARWLERLAAAGLVSLPTGGDPDPDPDDAVLLVGAATRSVLPTVDGTRDYLDGDLPGPDDATDAGVFVEAWDDGRIAVGNGAFDSHWVRDDLTAQALAIEDPEVGSIVVLASTDLYMLFRPDVEAIRERALAQLDEEEAARTDIVVATTHNHHGPDTAFDVNHAWFDTMVDQVADAIVEAVDSRRPATLHAGRTDHWFGMRDSRDPMIIDPSMNVLQAREVGSGETIGTAVQWNNHVEVTLGWSPPDPRPEDCLALGEDESCTQRNRYFTADYPGHLRRVIEEEAGGVAVYVLGALGGLTTPLRAPVWEVDDEVGLGDQHTPPAGAVPTGGAATFTEANFRRAVVIGEQAGLAALRALEDGEQLEGPFDLSYRTEDVYSRISHTGFRVLLALDPRTGRPNLGSNPTPLFTCPAQGPKNAETCVDDGFESASPPPLHLRVRVGDHGLSQVGYLQVGDVGMAFVPGEPVGELTIGLPAGFDDTPERWFEGPFDRHASGSEYETGGYLLSMMEDTYRWTVGAANDHVGYIVPLSDWRIACIGERCPEMYAEGLIDHPDSFSGAQCKAIIEDPSLLEAYGDARSDAEISCHAGQTIGQASGHYEETVAAGWDLAADLLDGFRRLTGSTSTERINPDFPGYWQGLPPPVG